MSFDEDLSAPRNSQQPSAGCMRATMPLVMPVVSQHAL